MSYCSVLYLNDYSILLKGIVTIDNVNYIYSWYVVDVRVMIAINSWKIVSINNSSTKDLEKSTWYNNTQAPTSPWSKSILYHSLLTTKHVSPALITWQLLHVTWRVTWQWLITWSLISTPDDLVYILTLVERYGSWFLWDHYTVPHLVKSGEVDGFPDVLLSVFVYSLRSE